MHACVKRSRDKDWCVVREAQEKQPTAHFEKADEDWINLERRKCNLLPSAVNTKDYSVEAGSLFMCPVACIPRDGNGVVCG